MTTNQAMLGVGLIPALAIGSQRLTSRLCIPALPGADRPAASSPAGHGRPQHPAHIWRAAAHPACPDRDHPLVGDARPGRPSDDGCVTEYDDVIIAVSGADGGTLAHTLAQSGKQILLLERGDFLPRDTGNWDPRPVFAEGKYHLYVVETSLFASTGAVNPAPTAIANANRVGEHLVGRMS